jgi:hypothetical protein
MKSDPEASSPTFADEFLRHYLKNGIGAMSKSDIDALVMHLLDKYTRSEGIALQAYSNQMASETLRAPLSRIKRLRYEAGLKYGGRAEDEAKRRFVNCLSKAVLELDKDKICLIVEDTLSRHWIQGHIKESGLVFDGSFNSEIVRVSPDGFFKVLRELLDKGDVERFEKKYVTMRRAKNRDDVTQGFKTLLTEFVKGAANGAGGLAVTTLLSLPSV